LLGLVVHALLQKIGAPFRAQTRIAQTMTTLIIEVSITMRMLDLHQHQHQKKKHPFFAKISGL